MFRQCDVTLEQSLPGRKGKHLEVQLSDAQAPGMRGNTEADAYRYMSSVGKHIRRFTFWGRWIPGQNSETHDTNEGYSLGNMPRAPKLWLYWAERMQLIFLDVPEKGPRELTFDRSDVWGIPEGLAMLYDAQLTGAGFSPAGKGQGPGKCGTSSNLFQSGPLVWKAGRFAF